MLSTGWIVLVTMSLPVFSTKLPSICRLSNGESGRCIEVSKCPKARRNNSSECSTSKEHFVCCPAMERIVTPYNPDPIPPPFPTFPPFTPAPFPTFPPYTPAPFPTAPPPTQAPFPTAPPPTPAPFPTAPPQTPQPVITPTALPIEATTELSSITQNIASAKCEEYKHRVIKRQSIITYVFGGTESLGKEFPHMAALGYGQSSNPQWLCGGSLISEQFVVTAAHCLLLTSIGDLVVVRLGDLSLWSSTDDANPQDFGVIQRFVHPQYRLPSQYNDIALLQLDRSTVFNSYIAPICLQTTMNLPNTNFIATGWGRTELRGLQSDTLLKVDLEYFPNDVCRQEYADVAPESLPLGIQDSIQICAGSYTEEKDTCQGDSGGPLQIREDALYLVGITSFGKACGVPNSPGVYTRVSYYVPWIEQIVWRNGK